MSQWTRQQGRLLKELLDQLMKMGSLQVIRPKSFKLQWQRWFNMSVMSILVSFYVCIEEFIWSVTLDSTITRLWIGNWVYWTLQHNLRLHFTHHCNIPTIILSHCLQQSPCNGFQWRTFPLLWIPELSPCLCHSNSRTTVYCLNIQFMSRLNSALKSNYFRNRSFSSLASVRTAQKPDLQ
jgi:hypothetical protein